MATSEPTRVLTPKQVAIRDAYLAGDSMEKIAKALGISITNVHYNLKRVGVESRSNLKDIPIGSRFGALEVVRYVGNCEWLCRCDCGSDDMANSTGLRKGSHTCCSSCRKPDTAPEKKRCTKCNVEYPNTPEFFLRNNQFRFGLTAKCRKCRQPEINRDGRRRLVNLRREVLSHYSGGGEPECACCGERTIGFLAIDHLEGSSQQDYKTHSNSERFFSHVRKEGYKLKAQVLCHNCNSCKSVYGHCVHKTPTDPLAFNRSNSRRAVIIPMTADEIVLTTGRTHPCRVCGCIYPRNDMYFPKHPQMSDGLLNVCKECDRKAHFLSAKARREQSKLTVLAHYCGELSHCSCCGITHPEFLTIDHIDGGGSLHRQTEKIGNLWLWVIRNRFPTNLRIQCYSCNMGRSFNGGTCPHDEC